LNPIRNLLGQVALKPTIERIVACEKNPKMVENIAEYLEATVKLQEFMTIHFPASTMTSAERLERVAGVCGLKMPKTSG